MFGPGFHGPDPIMTLLHTNTAHMVRCLQQVSGGLHRIFYQSSHSHKKYPVYLRKTFLQSLPILYLCLIFYNPFLSSLDNSVSLKMYKNKTKEDLTGFQCANLMTLRVLKCPSSLVNLPVTETETPVGQGSSCLLLSSL